MSQAIKDALADAETFLLAARDILGWDEVHPYFHAYTLAGLPAHENVPSAGGYSDSAWYAKMARESAHAAFRAVPELRGGEKA